MVTMDDLRNLEKAFNLLDKEKTGQIVYDANRITDCKDVILM
jgi:Ca2+-binding EF-hand superfamily protein